MQTLFARTSVFLLLCIYFLQACGHGASNNLPPVPHTDTVPSHKVSQQDATIPGGFNVPTKLVFDSSEIGAFLAKYPAFEPLRNDMLNFYRLRHFSYAWFNEGGLIEQAGNLHNRVLHLGEEGLPQKINYGDSLSNLLDQPEVARSPETELMLTAQYFNYANTVYGGLSEKTAKSLNWYLPRKQMDVVALLDSVLADHSMLDNGYSFRQYNLLKENLRKYKTLGTEGNWTIIPTTGKFALGDAGPVIARIRTRLVKLGDLPEDSHSDSFDESLDQAIRKFQNRMGLSPDGKIGKSTLQKLNITPEEYIRKIMVNMERCRWVPVTLENNYFIVNIPSYQLLAYEHDSLLFSMRVVVGAVLHETVIFNGDLKYVVFSPYWNVPASIMKKEILPGIKRDPKYLAKHHMEWNGNQIRQKPGPWNSLGYVKFLFPNSFNIYLHDTPSRNLFNEDNRAFSHGCIRVAEPLRLATYLLRDQPSWTERRIDAAMHSGKEQYVTLATPVPVYIAYLTAYVDRAGQLNIRDDIYKRDDKLASTIIKSND